MEHTSLGLFNHLHDLILGLQWEKLQLGVKKTELSSKQISESMTLNVVEDDIMKYFIV